MPSIFETLLNQQSKNKRTADLNTILNGMNADKSMTRDMLFGTGNGTPGMVSNIGDPALTNQNRLLQYLYGNGQDGGGFGNLNDTLSQFYNPSSVSSAFGGNDPYGQNIPGLQDALKQMQGVLPQLQSQSSLASQVFSGGGWTPQSQASFDALSPIINGQTQGQQAQNGLAGQTFASGGQNLNPLFQSYAQAAQKGLSGTNPILDFASNGAQKIFGQGGQTGDTNAGIDASKNLFANGGMNAPLNTLVGAGTGALAQNGLTPTGAQGETSALNVLNSGGQTPTTQGLQKTGLGLAQQPSLLPMDQVTSMARNEAGTSYQNNMEGARRQALARGGGAGSNVASGLQNQGLADYSDTGSQLQSSAVQKALTDQQGLQLQQAGLGAQMAQQGGALENSRLGTAGSTLTGLENVAANRFGTGGSFLSSANSGANANSNVGLDSLLGLTGLQSNRELGALGMAPGISNAGTSQAGTYGQLGLGSNAQNLQGLGLGNDMFNSAAQSQQAGINSQNNLIGTQGQYALGAGNLANSGANDFESALNNIFGGNLSASNQGLNRTTGQFSAQNQGFNQQGNLLNFAGQQQNNSTDQLQGLLKQLFPFLNNSTAASNTLAEQNSHDATNPWGGTISDLTSALPALLKTLHLG